MASPYLNPYLNFSGLTFLSIPSRKVDQALVRNGTIRFRVFLFPQSGQGGLSSPTFMIRSKRRPQTAHSNS